MPAVPGSLQSEPQLVTRSQGPSATTKVPPGELAGIIVDAATGAPLPRTQVVVLYEGSAMTDSSGRFRVTIPHKPSTIQVRREGYIDANAGVIYRPDSGFVAVFALQRLELRCFMTMGPVQWPGVTVIARDAVTGESPPGTVSVAVRDGDYRDSVATRAESTRPLVVEAAHGRQGRYEVIVRSDGYRAWWGRGATRSMPDCGSQFRAATFHAWLIPN
jgi:hypothetical protein